MYSFLVALTPNKTFHLIIPVSNWPSCRKRY